ncbi:MAG: acylneuraminate cytidylyltransferase family protein [Pedobacter sp.]|nr:acylneuraminate cytidylyltransferase family protein [Pedobacter sp.]
MHSEILITICARGGSKGIPGKNIRALAGKPLIMYTIELARQIASNYGADIALSTDDQAIKDVVLKAGLSTDYQRPTSLATDSAGKIDAINDLILHQEETKNKRYDYILDLDVTSPLRTIGDVTSALVLLKNKSGAINLFSVNPAARNPYFNMVEQNSEGFFTLVKKARDGAVMTRQSAPAVFDLNASFYWYKRDFFSLGLKSAITDRSIVFAMDHICFDLDHLIDFEFLDYLIKNNKLDFKIC